MVNILCTGQYHSHPSMVDFSIFVHVNIFQGVCQTYKIVTTAKTALYIIIYYHVWTGGFLWCGTRIVSGSSDKTVRVWDADRGVQIGSPLHGHTNQVRSVAFSPDGTRIVSGSDDETVGVWDADRCVQIGSPLHGHTDWVRSVAFSPDGTRIVSRESHGYGYPPWVVGMGTGGYGCGYRFWIPIPIPIPTWWVFRG